MRIILGSQSPRRLEILRTAVPSGHTIEVMPADIDEKAIRLTNPGALTLAIALAKNDAVTARIEGDAVIVTADTVSVCTGRIREKPRTGTELHDFVQSYSYRPVAAITSVVVRRMATGWSGSVTDEASVQFRYFTQREIAAIVAEPAFYGSAGGYLIEHPLMRDHVMEVRGDPDTIQGLPARLVRLLVADALNDASV